jgi:hypothetical protein
MTIDEKYKNWIDRNSPEIDFDKIDQAILALLYVNLDTTTHRAWKSFDWDAMERIHEKGWISDPKNKTKSVMLTDEGMDLARESFRELFFESEIANDQSERPFFTFGPGHQ